MRSLKFIRRGRLSVVLVFGPLVFGLWPLVFGPRAYLRIGTPSKDFPYDISHFSFAIYYTGHLESTTDKLENDA
jgi:uncharacterized RDD family membrane protein YckC